MSAKMVTPDGVDSGPTMETVLKLLENQQILLDNISSCQQASSIQEGNAHQAFRREHQVFRKEMRSRMDKQADRITKHMDSLGRQVGAFHEKLCRVLLGRNIEELVSLCAELSAFSTFSSRLSENFHSLEGVCSHLQLTNQEVLAVKNFFLQEFRTQPAGKAIPISFLRLLLHELYELHSENRDKWSANAKKLEQYSLDILGMLSQTHFVASEILRRLKCMKDWLKCMKGSHMKKVKMLQESFDAVIDLFSISEIPRHQMRMHGIMEESWGLLMLFWLLKQKFWYAVLELDLLGTVNRCKRSWAVGYGEIKSSDKKGLEKGTRQLDFAQEVFDLLLKAACGSKMYELKVAKCLFCVHNDQDENAPVIQKVEDIIQINVSQLSC